MDIKRKAVSGILLILLLNSVFTLSFFVQPVKSEPTLNGPSWIKTGTYAEYLWTNLREPDNTFIWKWEIISVGEEIEVLHTFEGLPEEYPSVYKSIINASTREISEIVPIDKDLPQESMSPFVTIFSLWVPVDVNLGDTVSVMGPWLYSEYPPAPVLRYEEVDSPLETRECIVIGFEMGPIYPETNLLWYNLHTNVLVKFYMNWPSYDAEAILILKQWAPAESAHAQLIESVDISVYSDYWEYDIKTTTDTRTTWYLYNIDKNLVHTYSHPSYSMAKSGTFGGYIPSGEDGFVRLKEESIDGDIEWWPSASEMYKIERHVSLKVIIDPGHNPTSKSVEYVINKGVSDKLKSKLEENGITVYLTNPSDDITTRASYANALKPNIFVSLHCNALEGFENGIPVGTARGSEVWIYDDTDSIEQTTKEHDLANHNIKGLTKEIESKLRDGDYAIWKEKEDPWPNGIPILRSVIVCPAVLLEMEFYDYGQQVTYKDVTYQNMLELMKTDVWLEDAAQGIANGILGFFEERELTITAYSPVDIVVKDPDGLTISKQLNEILGATYIEIDLDGDGDLEDQIRIPDRKIGDYHIAVKSETDASPMDTYTLELSEEGITTVLAENIAIRDIPVQPYIVRSTETEMIPLYYIRIESQYGDPKGEDWYNAGSIATFSVTSPEGFIIQQVFVGWSEDSTATTTTATIVMDGPKSVTANWRADYTQLYGIIGSVVVIILVVIFLIKRGKLLTS